MTMLGFQKFYLKKAGLKNRSSSSSDSDSSDEKIREEFSVHSGSNSSSKSSKSSKSSYKKDAITDSLARATHDSDLLSSFQKSPLISNAGNNRPTSAIPKNKKAVSVNKKSMQSEDQVYSENEAESSSEQDFQIEEDNFSSSKESKEIKTKSQKTVDPKPTRELAETKQQSRTV